MSLTKLSKYIKRMLKDILTQNQIFFRGQELWPECGAKMF